MYVWIAVLAAVTLVPEAAMAQGRSGTSGYERSDSYRAPARSGRSAAVVRRSAVASRTVRVSRAPRVRTARVYQGRPQVLGYQATGPLVFGQTYMAAPSYMVPQTRVFGWQSSGPAVYGQTYVAPRTYRTRRAVVAGPVVYGQAYTAAPVVQGYLPAGPVVYGQTYRAAPVVQGYQTTGPVVYGQTYRAAPVVQGYQSTGPVVYGQTYRVAPVVQGYQATGPLVYGQVYAAPDATLNDANQLCLEARSVDPGGSLGSYNCWARLSLTGRD